MNRSVKVINGAVGAATSRANELQVFISMAGIDIAKSDETASKMMSWSLIEAASITRMT
jgi:hypothetical protein